MKTLIKTIKTITAVLMIVAGLLALFTIDNAQSITTLILFAIIMVAGVSGGIYLLYSTYPKLADLSEFEEADKRVFEDYEREIEELREHNLVLIDRYNTLKNIIKTVKFVEKQDKEKYPNLYHIIYEEDLRVEGNRLKKEVNDELERFKEIYN